MTTTEFNTSLVNLNKGLEYFALSLTNNREDAKDLVQETLLKALMNKEKFEDNTNLKAWIYTILKNTFINNYRRSKKIGTIIDNSVDSYQAAPVVKSYSGLPDSEFSAKEISSVISLISDEQRIPFEMQNAGFKYKEIAEEMNLSIGTVKSRIFFCRKKLMDYLYEYRN